MTIKEKLGILENLLDVERDTLTEDTELNQINEWDSIAVISTIAMFDDMWGKSITAKEVKEFRTVKDILDKMN